MASSREGDSGFPSPRRHDSGGTTCSRRKHIMAGEQSGRSGRDDGPTADGGTTAEHRPLLQAMACSSGGTTSANQRSTTLR
jgi:hypothetical protein